MAYRPDTLERVGLAEGVRLVLFPPASWGGAGLAYLPSSSFGLVYSIPRFTLLVSGRLLNYISRPISLALTFPLTLVMMPIALLRDAIAPSFKYTHPRLAVWLVATPAVVAMWLSYSPAKAVNLLLLFWDWLFGPKYSRPPM